MFTRKRMVQLAGFVLCGCFLAGDAAAQTVWQKMKQNVLQQQCQQGIQKACQALAALNQTINNQKQSQQAPQGQAPGQQPGQPAVQPSNGGGRQPANAGQGGGRDSGGSLRPPNGTKVVETVMAPISPGGGSHFFVSPHGVHVATISNSGSRTVVYYDGVAGPKFDEVLGATNEGPQMVFSPDGKRFAYCAHVGSEYVVMVDGKELARSSESWLGGFSEDSCRLGFSSNSEHVYYSSNVAKSLSTGDSFTRFVWDGKVAALPTRAGNLSSGETGGVHLALSPDGNHYAYVAIDPADGQKWALVIDGKVAPYRGGDPQWSADSQHLYTIINTPVAHGQVAEAMLDGKPFMRADRIELHVSSAGNMYVAEVYAASNTTQPQKFMVVDGKKVPGSELVILRGANFDQVTISPDGKHYAARFATADGRKYVFTDGKRQQDYQSVDHIRFTTDSSRVTYTAFANARPYVVIGDQESDACLAEQSGPVIDTHGAVMTAPVGSRAGTICGNTGGAPTVFMDGKTLRMANGVQSATDLRFSPDGQHYAYSAGFQGGGTRLVLDGVVQMNSNLGTGGEAGGRRFVFSPDGQHIAVYSASPSPTGEYSSGLFLDGKYIPNPAPTSYFVKLQFTADSKHIVWAQTVPGSHGLRYFVDNRPVAEADIPLASTSPEAWWDMAPDGSLMILGQDENNLKRLTITPSAETSIAALGGGGIVVAKSGD